MKKARVSLKERKRRKLLQIPTSSASAFKIMNTSDPADQKGIIFIWLKVH
jgi:hypothetical protein